MWAPFDVGGLVGLEVGAAVGFAVGALVAFAVGEFVGFAFGGMVQSPPTFQGNTKYQVGKSLSKIDLSYLKVRVLPCAIWSL